MAVSPVEAVPARDVEGVIDVLTAAFDGYEAMTYMLGPEGTPEDLRALVGYFVRSRSSVGSPIFGVRDSDVRLIGAAITDPPHPPVRSETVDITATLGADVVDRMHRFGHAVAPLEPHQPHHYVGMIGVDAAHRGRGVARAILDTVQERASTHPDSIGVVLTTERPANVRVYESMGFVVLGEVTTDDGLLRSWTLLREN